MNPAEFFYASLDKDVTYLKTGQPILFNSVIDPGKLYDERHGTFKPRLSGYYCFTFTVGTKNTSEAAAVRLEISTRKVATAVTDIPSATASLVISQASNQAIVYMKDTDLARVVIDHHDTGPIIGFGYTNFSGFLMKND
ncbi:uncharacterized protein LOC132732162 [Ruditapes philippinarum]|uniref:uncharacterized protein LOC132732162 n=1 Tax=Ruditapes philippinarum TaxID=129788 RepID=UPI00295B948D|nr:uncharacterized protein LOC132732162 [Ruditapes philippinarum]